MEFDKLRGDYKEAMESIDLSKDSRDRILSNIRLEDLSVPAEKKATRKRFPFHVVLPVAGAAFAVLILFGVMLGIDSNRFKNMTAVPDAPKTHNADLDEEVKGKVENMIEDDGVDGPADENRQYKVDLKPANDSKNFISGGVDKSVKATAGGVLGKLSFLPFTEYTDCVVTDERYCIDVHRYEETGGAQDTITIIVADGINDIGGAVVEIHVDGKDAILYGSKDDDEYNRALYTTDNNLFVVIESGKYYSKTVWEDIVKGASVGD